MFNSWTNDPQIHKRMIYWADRTSVHHTLNQPFTLTSLAQQEKTIECSQNDSSVICFERREIVTSDCEMQMIQLFESSCSDSDYWCKHAGTDKTPAAQSATRLKTLMEKQKRKRGDEGVKVLSISTTPSYLATCLLSVSTTFRLYFNV